MSTEVSSSKFEDLQIYREEYIRELDKHLNKTEYAQSNASSLYALGLTMYSQNFSLDSLIYNSFAMSALDEQISLHPEQIKVLSLIDSNRGLVFRHQRALEKHLLSLSIFVGCNHKTL